MGCSPHPGRATLLFGYLLLSGCPSEVAGPNLPPVAVAGPDRVVRPLAVVTLDGIGSYDPGGDPIVEHRWRLVAVPKGASPPWSQNQGPKVQLIPDAPGVWMVRLIVSDGALTSAPVVVAVRVEGEACQDGDADGHRDEACGGDDCDDGDPDVHPGVLEGPGGDPGCDDGIDNDCDELTDQADTDCTSCERDEDGDGHVDARCPGGTDCDDDPAGCGSACHPGAAEVCDSRDNDCDPATPDGSGDPRLGDPCDGSDSDTCEDDQLACDGGIMACPAGNDDTEGPPGDATCSDTLDNDCDGATDASDPECQGGQDFLEALLTGTETLGSAETQRSQPLEVPVVAERSILLFNYSVDTYTPRESVVLGQLADDGNAIMFRRHTQGAEVQIRWTVIQMRNVSVQRGIRPISNEDSVIGIGLDPAVAPDRTLPLASYMSDGENVDLNDWFRARVVDASTLELARGTGCCDAVVAWQVVELDVGPGLTVQSGDAQLGEQSYDLTRAVSPAVVPDRSVLFVSMYPVEQQIPALMASHAVRGRLASGTDIVFDREGVDLTVELGWTLLTWDALRVQRGDTTFAAGTRSRDVPLTTAVDASRSFVWIPTVGRQGKCRFDQDDRTGEAWFWAELSVDGNTVTLQRASAADTAGLSWSVVEFR